ncbi:MAG: PspA/IM30 family protein [Polyangiaceae bacterium]|nr:PspA/IM30 family protein [Polyangiaceae bacterium]
MGIFDRMGKVISSNVNNLLDKAEDDGKLIELNLEEMAEQLKRGRQEVVSAVAAEKQLKKKADDLQSDLERWDKRAELALKSGDEALAREALKQKKRVREELELAEKARVEQRDTAVTMKKELERMEQKLEELKMRKGTIVARAQQSRSTGGELGSKGGSSAFDNFKRMEEKIEGREAEGLAMAEVEEALGTTDTRDLESKFRDLEHGKGSSGSGTSSEVEDELAALKKRIRI